MVEKLCDIHPLLLDVALKVKSVVVENITTAIVMVKLSTGPNFDNDN
jgi:hypothetical protein